MLFKIQYVLFVTHSYTVVCAVKGWCDMLCRLPADRFQKECGQTFSGHYHCSVGGTEDMSMVLFFKATTWNIIFTAPKSKVNGYLPTSPMPLWCRRYASALSTESSWFKTKDVFSPKYLTLI